MECEKFINENKHRISGTAEELIEIVSEVYKETGELKLTAERFNMSPLKVRKILITAGIYKSKLEDEINELYNQGKTITQIMEITGLKKSSVNGYFPYTKSVYNTKEISANAERIQLYRRRKRLVSRLQKEQSEEILWLAVIEFQKYPFYTYSGLPFSYTLKTGKNGAYNREILIDRRSNSKSLAWSSICLAFERARQMQGVAIKTPKMLGDIRGISYIYAMFKHWGIIK